jgi:hypothetical protein
MREFSIPIPGGFLVIISAWITGAVLCQALGNVNVGSWGNVWIQRSGVIVIQVRNCIVFSPRFDTHSLVFSNCTMDCVLYACVRAGANLHLGSENGIVVRLWAGR